MKLSARNLYDENYLFHLSVKAFKTQLTQFISQIRWRIPLNHQLLSEQADISLRTLRYLLDSHRCGLECYHKLLLYFHLAGALTLAEQEALQTLWGMHWSFAQPPHEHHTDMAWQVLGRSRCHAQRFNLNASFLYDFAFERLYPLHLLELKTNLRNHIFTCREMYGTTAATEQKALNLKRETLQAVEHTHPTACLATFFKILAFYNDMAEKKQGVRGYWCGACVK